MHIQAQHNLEPYETDNQSETPKYEGFSAQTTTAISLNELFINFMAAGFTENEALTLVSKIALSKE